MTYNLPYKNKATLQQLLELNKTTYQIPFDLVSFQRKYRSIFKFCIPSPHTFIITSKITGLNCMIDIELGNYFTVKRSYHSHIYSFYCLTHLDLVEKLIKHNLY